MKRSKGQVGAIERQAASTAESTEDLAGWSKERAAFMIFRSVAQALNEVAAANPRAGISARRETSAG